MGFMSCYRIHKQRLLLHVYINLNTLNSNLSRVSNLRRDSNSLKSASPFIIFVYQMNWNV